MSAEAKAPTCETCGGGGAVCTPRCSIDGCNDAPCPDCGSCDDDDAPTGPAMSADTPPPADVEALARFELDLADVYIRDIWAVVFGPDTPQPRNRNQALSRILACCCNVAWPHTAAAGPHLRLLPVGFERDGEVHP